MSKLVVLAAGALLLPATLLVTAARAAIVTVFADSATLQASASGCARVQDSALQFTGASACGERSVGANGAPFFETLAADADDPRLPWGAQAEIRRDGGSLAIRLLATTRPFGGIAECGGAPCSVTEADAVASVSWSTVFGVEGAGATLRVRQFALGAAPYLLTLRDLTREMDLAAADGWSLDDGHRYALTFVQTKSGGACTRECVSLTEFLFGDATWRRSVDAASRTVPTPGTAGLLAVALVALGAALRRPRAPG